VKFQSPFLKDRKIAIDVGRHVFSALALVEIPLASIACYFAYSQGPATVLIAPICLGIQALFIRPVMRIRSELIVKGEGVPESKGVPAHLVFVVLEVVKSCALLYCAISLVEGI
jgi:hypothetical protein